VPKTTTITLKSGDAVLQIVAERKADDSAKSYVITIDDKKESQRGMSQNHPSFEAAKKFIAEQARKAEGLGWQRKVTTRGFTPKPDAFSSLPAAPAPVAKLVKAKK
jgi:hypothetical protein